ncbi:MAG: Nif3-like dinuclear metal center hexameric protein [Clostridia bacterium]|nr:Nif3-like dinuclear metal center hexameric protein [Clostridia bacterium]
MKVKEIVKIMNEIAPPETALSFDHVGLMTGYVNNSVNGVMVCLDLDEADLNEAIENNCNMIITHHPLIFNPVSDLTEDNVRGRLLCGIIRAGITVFSAHTNLDFADGGVNDALAAKLGLSDVVKADDGEHRFGLLQSDMSFKEFAVFANNALGAEGIRCVIPENYDTEKKICRVGVSCGSFDRETAWVYANDIDVLVTGEVKHSDAIDLSMERFATLSCGHYPTEVWGAIALYERLSERVCGKKNIRIMMSSAGVNPLKTV